MPCKTQSLIATAAVLLIFAIQSCGRSNSTDSLQKALEEYVNDKDANIGIAVIVEGKDTIEINGDRDFPMLSVYKFPIAVALGDYLRVGSKLLPDSITISTADLKPDTYSPMREKYGDGEAFQLPFYELMAYALQQSDNNASDILLKIMGGPESAMSALRRLGVENINIASTEEEMHANPQLCYANTATPLSMARLFESFDHGFDDMYTRKVKQLMETCATGESRLVKPLKDANAVIGHKTGTGFQLPNGRLMAINDAGYVHLPDGTSYSIAVFIENSGYDVPQTEELIARISEIVYTHISK